MTVGSTIPSYEALPIPEDFVREREYRLARYRAFASQLDGRPMAIYGSGINARCVIEDDCSGEIVAVADDNAIGQVIGDYTIVGIGDLPSLGVKALVICAQASSALAVFRRIGGFCRSHGIAVYSMYGFDFFAAHAELCAAEAMPLSERLRAIARCDVLAVDAGVMPFKTPARSIDWCLSHNGRLASCLGDVLRYMAKRGCPIVFIAEDARMTPERVATLAVRSGFTEPLRFFLSTDSGLSCDGGMLRALCEAYPGRRVGVLCSNVALDSLNAAAYEVELISVEDVWRPDWMTLDTTVAKSEADEPRCCGDALPSAWARNDADRILARCAEEVCSRLSVRQGEQVAYTVRIIGPLVVGFIMWLTHRLRERPCDAVLFGARDGWILKDVYDQLRATDLGAGLPPSVYLYTSRLAGERALKSAEQLDCVYAYFASCGLELGGTYAFVDFVGAGTCQRQLEDFAPFSLHGYYVGSRIGDGLESELDCNCLIHETDGDLTSYYIGFEPYLSSLEPSVVEFSAAGRPVFATELRSPAELEILRCVHAGIRQYACLVLESWAWGDELPTQAFLVRLMQEMPADPSSPMHFYDDFRVDDAFGRVGLPGEPASIGLPAYSESVDTAIGRTVHEVLLGLLAAFDAVCEEFELRYIATHGTLLGAVRHGGFVPWDDDLDVAMPRADYDRLVELAAAGVFPEPFFLQTPENDPECFYGGYAKLRDSSTSAIELEHVGRDFNQGMWMDIMPLDNCPEDTAVVEQQQRIVRQFQRVLYAQTYRQNMWGLWDANPAKISAYFIAANRFSRERLCRLLRKACMGSRKTGLLTVFAGNYQWMHNNVRYAAEDVADARRVPFEGTSIPIPAHAERWLEFHYGPQWAEAPDEAKRESRHEVAFEPNVPYAARIQALREEAGRDE